MCDCVSAVTQRSRWQIQRLSYRAYSKKSAITTADCIRSEREQNGCCTIVSPVRIQSKVKKMVCPESKRSWSWSLSRLKFVDSAAMVTAAVPACPLVLVYSFMCAKTYFHNGFCIPINYHQFRASIKSNLFDQRYKVPENCCWQIF